MQVFSPTHIMLGVPFDHKRVDTPVELIGKQAMEPSYYRVRLKDGRIVIVNDSMLKKI